MPHKGFTLWFTGLSGAGKSTLANRLAQEFRQRDYRFELLDGDELRTHLSKGLGFSKEDRDTNVRRIGYVAKLLSRNGVIAITAAISPYRDTRNEVRREHGDFIEVYAEAALEKLTERDVKGLYRKALAGEITNFTGVSDPYEPPAAAEVVVHTDRESVDESLDRILTFLEEKGYIDAEAPVAAGGF
jgi:adenylylsulfate kinase